jgi:hypothetical protein
VPVQPGVTSGIELGFPWTIQIEPFAGNLPPSNAGQVWRVTVSVRNPHGRQLASVSTLALGASS